MKRIVILISLMLIGTQAIANAKPSFELVLGQPHKNIASFTNITAHDIPRVMFLRSTPVLLQRYQAHAPKAVQLEYGHHELTRSSLFDLEQSLL